MRDAGDQPAVFGEREWFTYRRSARGTAEWRCAIVENGAMAGGENRSNGKPVALLRARSPESAQP